MATPKQTNPNLLYETASAQGGYVTLAQAQDAGYSAQLIEYHIKGGRLARVGRGMIRLTHFRPHPHEELIVLWLWSERRGVFSHQTALYLSGLCDERITPHQMIVPSSWKHRRRKVPGGLMLHYEDLTPDQIDDVAPLRVTNPIRTFADFLSTGTRHDLVQEAIRRRERAKNAPPQPQEAPTPKRQGTPQNELIEDLNSVLASLGSTHRLPRI